MRVVEFLRSIRDGSPVEDGAIQQFLKGVGEGSIPDYQAAAYLMAVYQRGLDNNAVVASTLAMRDSGEVLDWSHLDKAVVDKHSTGGVGDKISLALAPLVAVCGVAVPMISGRGLGHTGGTLDKLESIPGFKVNLDLAQFKTLVEQHGFAMIGATESIAPADKKLYALRDVTATVESIPLITASILCKKLAEGLDSLVLDVKVGSGAFMKDLESARALAQSLVRVGSGAGVKVRACLTRMDQPLGWSIGNSLEVQEAIEILRGDGPDDTTELTYVLAEEMLVLAGVAQSRSEARKVLTQALTSGAALDCLRAVIDAQGGDGNVVDNVGLLPQANERTDVIAKTDGYVARIEPYGLGIAAMALGAGRATAEDTIDPAVGIELKVVCGDRVSAGDRLAIIHHNTPAGSVVDEIAACFEFTSEPPAIVPLVIDRIGSDDLD